MSVITFLSDYGYTDEFVGVCHGVLATWCPQAQVIDITHGIARHNIRAGAVALRGAVTYMPPGVHLAVVDPYVGGTRRAVALRTGARNHLLVGPDNGLLALAAERLGGVVEAVDVGRSPHRLEPVCATFHGRDIFAPVAAALAGGAPLNGVGEPMAPADLVGLELPRSRVENGTLIAQVRTVDRFGNTQLNVDQDERRAFGVSVGVPVEIEVVDGRFDARCLATFGDADPGELLVYEDAQQQLAVAVNRGSA
ncbi:MAG: SAM-dependent chlorinase/fluorinase, partial [Actinobacteria bacterium]|nr:SAM-dependent chlorinase/fluorinase [Actinomycetota bacterium]